MFAGVATTGDGRPPGEANRFGWQVFGSAVAIAAAVGLGIAFLAQGTRRSSNGGAARVSIAAASIGGIALFAGGLYLFFASWAG